MSKERPLGVTIFAVIALIYGIGCIFAGLFADVLSKSIASYYMPYFDDVDAELVELIAVIALVAIAVRGIISIVVAGGLWAGKRWAWWLAVVLSGLAVLSIFGWIEVILSGIFVPPVFMLDLLNAAIGAIAVWYLLKPHVKDYFGVNVKYST